MKTQKELLDIIRVLLKGLNHGPTPSHTKLNPSCEICKTIRDAEQALQEGDSPQKSAEGENYAK